MMKKFTIAIIVVLLAAWFFLRQPELLIKTEMSSYSLYEYGGFIFSINKLDIEKIISERLFDFKLYDIDGDLSPEIIALSGSNYSKDFGQYLVIYDISEKSGIIIAEEIYRKDFSGMKPWKIDVCNLDNDNQADIFIGVYKSTLFYEDFRKRPFFYSWDGEKLNKKWLGSFFSDSALKDIAFGDYFDLGTDVAAVLEESANGEFRMGYYSFVGFGFENMKTSKYYKKVKSVKTIYENNKEYVELDFTGLKKSIKLNYN